MRRLLWMIFLFGAYLWVMSSGHDRMLMEQGKQLYRYVIAWLDDAEVDFQTTQRRTKKTKARHRRWD